MSGTLSDCMPSPSWFDRYRSTMLRLAAGSDALVVASLTARTSTV